MGLKNLGITFRQLYEDINTATDKETLEYSLNVFFALLKVKINDIETNSEETFADIHKFLFQRTKNNLLDLAERIDNQKMQEAYEIKKLIELKINEEVTLRNYL